ncbi:flagellar motor protein MotB [Fibrisoma montanum]|uniref:Flagellar motor protein MotB n=1 Tax=Fibrisoma montanum TaxID=2305895 RepID=A0A418M0X0_9BACT|nr:OmpA family protein [Fibrisoma montanum]RIV19128.1 flagellar motor protein MotB [Fibrisoma montanum]
MVRFLFLSALLACGLSPLLGQSLTNQADRQFDQLAYASAIDLYEQALKNTPALPETERRAALAKLGFSYHQQRDTKNAERVYRELMGMGDLPAEHAPAYLYYAQSLAANGKFREAQEAFGKYNTLVPADQQAMPYSRLYREADALSKKATTYKVEFLTINTRKAEFSPMLYGNGLVFVSASGGSKGSKKVIDSKNGPFLDLYFMPEADALRGRVTTTGTPRTAKRKTRTLAPKPNLGGDEYTALTANDSRTVGFYGGNNVNQFQSYDDRPVGQSERFQKSLNTRYHEGPATFSKDGARVIFTRNNYNNGHYGKSKDGVNKLKLYTATQTNGVWSEAEELPFNSDEFSSGHPALGKGPNGQPDQLLYFASDRPGGFGGTDIYVAKWGDGKWLEPVNLGKDVNSKGNELFPFVDEKGNLYFSSDGRPGLGELDIFFAQLGNDGQQVKSVQNLGEPLNSPKDDFGIVTDGDRKAGYFSSNRKNGGSDDDLYRFTREGSLYPCRQLTISVFDAQTKEPLADTPLHVDDQVGSARQRDLKTDANGLVRLCLDIDNNFQFLVSREGYLANKVGFSTKDLADDKPSRLDIALAKPTEEAKPAALGPTSVRGRVLTQADNTPIEGAKVILVSECDGTSQQVITGADGSYGFTVTPGCDYAIEAIKERMGTAGSRIDKDGSGSTDILMFRKGDVIRIDNIYYDLNKATIRPDAAKELDKVVALMKKYPGMKIEMRSHTDSRATAPYNRKLSANRAKAATVYLKSKGIAPKRMIAKGYGEDELLNKCADGVDCSEEQHQQNRRTEIKVLTLE